MEIPLAQRKKLENQIGGSSVRVEADHISAVFENDVIFRRIGDHLGMPDLKILRQTCHLLLAKVNGHRKFTQNLKVTISDEAIDENVLSQHRTIQWKGVKILVNQTGARHFSGIPANFLVHLELHHKEESGTSSGPLKLQRRAQGRTACFKFLKKSEFTNLESLTIDLNLFMYDIPAGALNDIVQRLKCFQLANKCTESFKYMSGRKRKTFEQNMNVIEGLPWSLKSLSSDPLIYSDFSSIPRIPTGKALGAILVSSINTVEEIKLAHHDFNLLPQIHGLRFPLLKNLNMSLEYDENNAFQFSAFLDLQPKLESLQLVVEGGISPVLLDDIKTICSSNKLHTFELNGDRMFTCFPALDSWTFIQGMTGLKQFSIHHEDEDVNSEKMTAILSYLPSTIERIDISSLYGSPIGNASFPISALTGLLHLTYLDAHDCGILKIDDALQSICRALTKLRVLHFGDRQDGDRQASYITDLGLAGESSCGTLPDSGISLNNLKGLQELHLYGCSRTTEQGLVKAVRFLELRVMEIDRVIPDPVLLEIAKNNPSLEFVSRSREGLPPHLVKDEGLVFRNLLAVNPRFTRIKSSYSGFDYLRPRSPRRVKCAVNNKPSYGVPSRLSDKSIMRCALNTMNIATDPGEDQATPVVMYFCNLSEQ